MGVGSIVSCRVGQRQTVRGLGMDAKVWLRPSTSCDAVRRFCKLMPKVLHAKSCREASESQEAEEAAVEVEHGMKREVAMILVSGGLPAICWSLLGPLGTTRRTETGDVLQRWGRPRRPNTPGISAYV